MYKQVDLLAADGPVRLDATVCIIGAGALGCLLARRLSDRGIDVVVVEAGADDCVDPTKLGFEPRMDGARYNGAFEGRWFGLGGSSSRWGGVLVPFSALDVPAAESSDYRVWSRVVEVVGAHAVAVRTLLGIEGASDFDVHPTRALGALVEPIRASDLKLGSAEMLPFQTRNLRRLVERATLGAITVVTNAVTVEWTLTSQGDGARVTELSARSRAGQSASFAAREYVIAAGAIESARILLEIDRATESRALLGRDSVGVGLGDHLSLRIADVAKDDIALVAKQFAPQFRGPLLKTLRISSGDMLRAGVRHFAHFVFPIENPGFQLAKKLMFGAQARRLPRVSFGEIIEGSRGLAALGFDRVVRSRLHVPDDTAVGLQLDVEQESVPENRLSLGAEHDLYGRARAVISWRVTDRDQQRIQSCAASVLAKWSQVDGVPRLHAVLSNVGGKPHDAYHPVGLTRMGFDAEAVVTPTLRVAGTTNLHLVSTGVFPSAGTANPTFSALCLAHELGGRLAVPS